MQVVRKQEEHVASLLVGIFDLDGLISPWISSHLARSQKLQTTFRSNVVGLTNILCEKQMCRHKKIKQYETKHFNTILPCKRRTRKLFVVAGYCILVQALTRTHQTA